ncbi:zona pellucida sperm-binding protein 4-like isoform X2 [Cynoglossus semilaevis]|uniref:zona pellucida sperm-binding protein 4-like isoform X2 n=1 Tax=Cynoglossus semilaevis TaxID=244447 RepID=UPI0007DCB839|nr:zona pellucida sperm-binding protein 4-like isoform X2 [Cynoglossus semilaevis]
MIYIRVQVVWLFVALALVSQLCWSHSAAQMKKKTTERRQQLLLPRVTCSARRVKAVFGSMVDENIHVRDKSGAAVPVSQSEDHCGVRVVREKNRNLSFLSRPDSCYAQIEHNRVVIPLQVQLRGEDQWFRVNISCPLRKRSSNEASVGPKLLPGKCGTVKALQVDCGHQGISSQACTKRGCCYDAHHSTCYYRLNACSLDGNFVFSVEVTDINPGNLTVKGHPECRPVVSTADTAVFKIGVTECGTKKKEHEGVVTYEVEVEERHAHSKAKYSPYSLQVQCEYAASDLQRAAKLRSLYAVTNPPPVVAQGVLKLQMRIAKDASFTSFFPENELPLTLPLRKVAYVEVSIAPPSPDPSLSLQVQDCFAHPVSRHSVWLLLYDGCPNPLDNMRGSFPVDKQGKTTSHSQVRRFNVKTFAFLDPQTGHPSEEEMYFYCWVEICTDDVDCAQSCTIISDGERQRREIPTKSDQLQLVSYGPLLLRQNGTEGESGLCVKQTAMLRVTVFVISGVAAALLLTLLFILISNVTKWTKKK